MVNCFQEKIHCEAGWNWLRLLAIYVIYAERSILIKKMEVGDQKFQQDSFHILKAKPFISCDKVDVSLVAAPLLSCHLRARAHI